MTIKPESSWIPDAIDFIKIIGNIANKEEFLRANPMYRDHIINIIACVDAEPPEIMTEQPQQPFVRGETPSGKPESLEDFALQAALL